MRISQILALLLTTLVTGICSAAEDTNERAEDAPSNLSAEEIVSQIYGSALREANGDVVEAEDGARRISGDLLKRMDPKTVEAQEEVGRAIELATAKANIYAQIAGSLAAGAIERKHQGGRASLAKAAQMTKDAKLAHLLLGVTSYMEPRPASWTAGFQSWLGARGNTGWWAAILLQGMAGEDWGLKYPPSAEQDVVGGKKRAMEYLESLGKKNSGEEPAKQPPAEGK